MFLSVIHIWNMLHLQQLKGMQSLNRASPYKTLLSTPTSPPRPPHPRRPKDSQLDLEKMLGRESYCTVHKCLIRFFFKWLLICISLRYGLKTESVARWNMAEMIFSLFAEKLALSLPWTFSTSAWQSTNWSCAVLSLFAIAVREFQVSNKMPDYLGKDQRKIKDDEKKDDKPIQGASDTLNHTKSRRDLLVTRLTSFSLRLHMETRIQIFH